MLEKNVVNRTRFKDIVDETSRDKKSREEERLILRSLWKKSQEKEEEKAEQCVSDCSDGADFILERQEWIERAKADRDAAALCGAYQRMNGGDYGLGLALLMQDVVVSGDLGLLHAIQDYVDVPLASLVVNEGHYKGSSMLQFAIAKGKEDIAQSLVDEQRNFDVGAGLSSYFDDRSSGLYAGDDINDLAKLARKKGMHGVSDTLKQQQRSLDGIGRHPSLCPQFKNSAGYSRLTNQHGVEGALAIGALLTQAQ